MKKTLTAGELIKLLSQYPESAKVELSVTARDLKDNPPIDVGLRVLRLPGDRSYDADENTVAFQVW